jgi:hypothetical protein
VEEVFCDKVGFNQNPGAIEGEDVETDEAIHGDFVLPSSKGRKEVNQQRFRYVTFCLG